MRKEHQSMERFQVELFNLFREDIRDLASWSKSFPGNFLLKPTMTYNFFLLSAFGDAKVELTTSKMNLYHLVGALFLKMMLDEKRLHTLLQGSESAMT